MKAFPMFIKTTGRRVVIVGGGEQAAQKARLILKTDAQIIFAAPELDPEIEALVDAGRATWHPGPLTEDFLSYAAMVFIATGCFAADVSAHAIAKAARCLVNVVDQPDLCDITTPSLVDRDPVVVAIGTEGTAPVLARQIKTQIEQNLPKNLGGLAALAGQLRPSVALNIERAKRRAFWKWVFAGRARALWERGAEAHAVELVKDAIADHFCSAVGKEGSVSIIDSGVGNPELQTLRAVQRLQDADVVFFDRSSDEPILELARRDAERVFVDASTLNQAWFETWVQRRMFAEAKLARSVVFLTSRFDAFGGLKAKWQTIFENEKIVVEFTPAVAPKGSFTNNHYSLPQQSRLHAM